MDAYVKTPEKDIHIHAGRTDDDEPDPYADMPFGIPSWRRVAKVSFNLLMIVVMTGISLMIASNFVTYAWRVVRGHWTALP